MRKYAVWLGGMGLVLAALVALAACQLIPGRVEPPPASTMTPFRIRASATFTAAPSHTPLPATQTPTPEPSSTPTQAPRLIPTFAPTEIPLPYQLQVGTQRYIAAFTRTDQGCGWSGVAGQVFDPDGSGAVDVIVVITGAVDGKSVDQVGATEAQSAYGPGGYEITLVDHLPASGEGLFIQLFDSQGRVLSKAEPFQLPVSCDHNLALMNFQALYTLQKSFLPVIGRAE